MDQRKAVVAEIVEVAKMFCYRKGPIIAAAGVLNKVTTKTLVLAIFLTRYARRNMSMTTIILLLAFLLSGNFGQSRGCWLVCLKSAMSTCYQ